MVKSALGFSLFHQLINDLPVRFTVFVISKHTSGDEHDAGGEAHLGLGGVFHAVHSEAGQGEN